MLDTTYPSSYVHSYFLCRIGAFLHEPPKRFKKPFLHLQIGKTSNRYAKTGFLFCARQIEKVEHKQVAPCYRLKTRILAAIPFYSFPTDSYFWPISLLPLNYRHNFSRLIMPPMYRSYELQPKPIDGLEPPTYRLQGDCTVIVLYRLSRGKAVPFSFLSVTVLYATVFWIASENTFAETPQLKLCKRYRRDSNTDYISVGQISNLMRYHYSTIPYPV